MQSEMPAPGSYEPFRLKEKIGEMMDYGRPLTKGFSRKDRDLADGLRDSMLKMYHLAVELEKKYYRKTTAQELDVELEWLRNLVRMAANKDLCGAKFAPPLSMHQYETWARYNTEIGCLLGKYIASVKKEPFFFGNRPFTVPDSRWQLEQWRQRRGVQFQPEQPALQCQRQHRGPFRFSSVKCQFRAVVLRRKGAVAYGVQQEVQTKRGLFPFPLRQGGKKFVLPWRRKRHTRLGEIIG